MVYNKANQLTEIVAMPTKSTSSTKNPATVKPKTYVKKSIGLASETVKARLHVWGYKSDLRESAVCDLRFKGDLGEFTAYLSEADARELALFILDNTHEAG
jgi:hypothetical protein